MSATSRAANKSPALLLNLHVLFTVTKFRALTLVFAILLSSALSTAYAFGWAACC
jgi:hypothetical protein